jgi:hypothetical protein
MITLKRFIYLGLWLTLISSGCLYANIKDDPTPAPLPDDSLSFCRQQKWARICLNTLLTYRCNQYFNVTSPIETQLCSAAAKTMVDYLDYKTVQVIEDNKIYRFKIIFTKELRSLIKKQIVQNYLRSLEIDLREAMIHHEPFDLFEYTLKFSKNRDLAIRWIAILFQDTTFSRVQVTYLEELASKGQLNQEEWEIKEAMKEIAILLEPKNLVKEKFQSWLKLYPSLEENDLNSFLNPSFYHFYPMALVASHLKQNQWTKRYAFIIPFTLNSDYEFQTLDPDRWPWRHPAPFQMTSNLGWKMRDIYSGLVGSLYGASREELTPSLDSFKKRFSTNPFETMQEWAHKK